MKVFVLEHVHEIDGCDDIKRIGIYASEHEAELAKARASRLDGFRAHPDGFHVSAYDVGDDHWTQGFVTVDADGQTITPPAGSRAA